jgi:histidine triad (HIT) family protein
MTASRKAGADPCVFCAIVAGEKPADHLHQDASTASFFDHSPLFPGHGLVVPKAHHVTLPDLPPELLAPLFAHARMLARAMVEALGYDGTFIAVNNTVSQTVHHLHVHVIPRRKGDGLKHFFWPRQGYKDDAEREAMRSALADYLGRNPT